MVVGNVVDLVVDHGARHAQLIHRPVQLGYCHGDVLHGQGGKPLEPVRVVHGQLVYSIVALAGNGQGCGRFPVVHVEGGAGRYHLHVHSQGVHVGNALLGSPFFHGINVRLVAVGGQSVPAVAGGDGPLKAQWFLVGVNVDGAQLGPPESVDWIGNSLLGRVVKGKQDTAAGPGSLGSIQDSRYLVHTGRAEGSSARDTTDSL